MFTTIIITSIAAVGITILMSTFFAYEDADADGNPRVAATPTPRPTPYATTTPYTSEPPDDDDYKGNYDSDGDGDNRYINYQYDTNGYEQDDYGEYDAYDAYDAYSEYDPDPCIDNCHKIYEITTFMAQFGDTVSVHFENLASGFVFEHYGDRVFFGASATKAPFALYIYQKARDGLTNLNSSHAFTQADYWGGSGFIRHRYEYGQTFTQHRLLHLMITPSDNIATRILRRIHGLTGYRQFIEDLGGNPFYIQNITYSYLTANEAGFYMREIFRFIDSGGAYASNFKENLLANRYPFIISDYPVASKSGWASNFGGAWHDMAIVYAPSPYTLALLSSLEGFAPDRVVYDAISMFFQEFNTRWFGE